ncbi:hypothetical protein [Maricaulis sp.]|uniref:hypothetical protein n=1 Tax=Maricaulis sp. TaxID=1486257 RepID=UPI00260C3AC9|nr:hypothetical protein [Maricaulis sp.]
MGRVLLAACLALACAACSTTTQEEDRLSRFLPPLPAMPSLPTMSISDVSIPGTNRQAPVADPSLEPVIYWRVIEDDILVIHANTHGCTARGDFHLDVEQYHEDIYTVRLNRTGEDLCSEVIPWGIQLGFGFEEIGVPVGGQVILLNPLDTKPWDWNPRQQQMAARR